ncbi:GNAT family N-acetyltransferase [Rhizobium halophytocola]|uniref:GNAT superfamily N-acetyltransferase n=1 Tax=Rhizobium halophytocola TaxID=735519 RepID=A0ABS4DYE2_9HYPH|nr:GNAT family N-acetyltransferase [Rhizobium halophytocola]MBP1850707.1 GNAT superfamily N-acetyltransferase [Rhizobium halophytocola]
MIRATARRATLDDIPFILATERLPGYEKTVGRFDEAEHVAQVDHPDWLYLVAEGLGLGIFQDIRHPDQNIQLRRFIVTEPSKGLGSLLLPAVLGHAFQHTDAHRIWLRLVDGNTAAVKLYAKCGFVREGIQRQAGVRPDGSRFDFIVMSVLRPEWEMQD